jgi:hypothetical protein
MSLRGPLVALFAVLGTLGIAHRTAAISPVAPPKNLGDAITEIDLARAGQLLERASGDATRIALERARLSIYLGACDDAAAQLSAPTLAESREGASLAALARSCARATASGFVIEDKEKGVWLRLQDDADRVLAPYIIDTAMRARDTITRDLGVDLPRPLRIDLVRDQFSLAAVSGLPVTAAETTGTLAVARWGRVILLSPRAATAGYPWQDTLAHEIAHLVITRATRDRAPLWLQEGLAKREESRWREARPFDDPSWADQTAREALIEGRSIGIDQLGPSIAMLPTPEAATTAFAEVSSFVKYWLTENGSAALGLLFLDLKSSEPGDVDSALKSVSGYTLAQWNARWQAALRDERPDPREERARLPLPKNPRQLARQMRLGDLLGERNHTEVALGQFLSALTGGGAEPSVRWRAARTHLLLQQPQSFPTALGTQEMLRGAHGGWFALEGRALRDGGRPEDAAKASEQALSLDPLAEDVACDGEVRPPNGTAALPADPARRALCASARVPIGERP